MPANKQTPKQPKNKQEQKPMVKSNRYNPQPYTATRRNRKAEDKRIHDIEQMQTGKIIGHLYVRHELVIWKLLTVAFAVLSGYLLIFK